MFAISPTDNDWFRFLSINDIHSNVNFWTPTPWNIRRLSPGDIFFFMLKSPIRKIGGYGEFVEYREMSVDEAWNRYGRHNGCVVKEELVHRLQKYKGTRSTDATPVVKSTIGCIVLDNLIYLDEPYFFEPDQYGISFAPQVVKIKYFDVEPPINTSIEPQHGFQPLSTSEEKLQTTRNITDRPGQGRFRAAVAKAYGNICCLSGEETPELLEAAHIQPYINSTSHHVQNGLFLRVDFHKLYDNGLLYIDENYTVHISPRVQSYQYQILNGAQISIPSNPRYRPSIRALRMKRRDFRYE